MAAPKGNTNALKHGLYAKHFSPTEQAGLRSMSPEDYRHEINMLRVAVKNMFQIHSDLKKIVERMLACEQPADVDGLAKITNSLALAVTALNTTARTYALFNGTDTSLNDSIEEAMDSLPVFLDDKYLIESRADEEDLEEVLVE
ncbi:MAG: hypothetical protein ABSF99_00420 [Anaerolineales bacterium]|jgi:hypothetical protein